MRIFTVDLLSCCIMSYLQSTAVISSYTSTIHPSLDSLHRSDVTGLWWKSTIFFALDCSIPSFDSNPQVLLVVSVLNQYIYMYIPIIYSPQFPHLFVAVPPSPFSILVSPDAQIFDNRRVLHARSQILPSDGERWVQGVFFWDGVPPVFSWW